jgi:hypothetical protein
LAANWTKLAGQGGNEKRIHRKDSRTKSRPTENSKALLLWERRGCGKVSSIALQGLPRANSMKCEICGLEYGLSHNCGGPLSAVAQRIAREGLAPPANAGLGYYLGEALRIVRWDDLAIRRNSKDSRATIFGMLFWLASALLILVVQTFPTMNALMRNSPAVARAIGAVVGIAFGLVLMALITFVQLGLCHIIAKWIFGATGKFSEVMRPLLLGWFVNCLVLIPVAGMLLAAIGWTAVLMMAFEEVDGIGRLQAFGISAGINICFLAIQFAMMPVTHHL